MFFVFSKYNAFQPSVIDYIEKEPQKADLSHIKCLIIHDSQDYLIPIEIAKNMIQQISELFPIILIETDISKRSCNKDTHLPANTRTNYVIDFLKDQKINLYDNDTIVPINKQNNIAAPLNWFTSKTSSQQFLIRRARDGIALTLLFGIIFCSHKIIKIFLSWIQQS